VRADGSCCICVDTLVERLKMMLISPRYDQGWNKSMFVKVIYTVYEASLVSKYKRLRLNKALASKCYRYLPL
jgi:hypothetical protein